MVKPNSVRISLCASKQTPVFLALFLSLGLALRIFSSHSFFFYPSTTATTTTPAQPPSISNSNTNSTKLGSEEGKCDLFEGEWVPDDGSGPAYTNRSCNIIESHQNCMRNGRPDSGYLKWRWIPRGCELPRFDANTFLHLMRNKSWAFIGDSISRNHVQSFVCILSQVEPAVEIYHDEQYKSKTWRFPTHNVTVSVIWSPYLIRADIFEDDDGVSTSETLLHLDKIDPKWVHKYSESDYVVIAGGKWFLKSAIYYENGTMTGCHYCKGARNATEIGLDYAYRRALRLVFGFVTSSAHRPFVLFRSITPDHFENGEWDTGGTCLRKSPFKEWEGRVSEVDGLMRGIEMEEFARAAGVAGERGVVLKMLDTTGMSVLRPDGHPGPYRQFHPFAGGRDAKVQYDCLHWCLPGPIDSWSDLVMEMIGGSL